MKILTSTSLLFLASVLAVSSQAVPNCKPVFPAYGCFNDQSGPHAVTNLVLDDTDNSLSVDYCTKVCTYLGFDLVGMTGHGAPQAEYYCYCGSSITSGAVPAPSGDCNLPCPQGSGSCGGDYRMVIYNVSCDGPLPPPPTPPGPPLNGSACSQPESVNWPFCNKTLSYDERVKDLVSRISLFEIGPQLTARQAPSIPSLGVNAYYYGLNTIHGITNPISGGSLCLDNGKCVTIWPAGAAIGASFNKTAWNLIGATTGIEMRALNNLNWGIKNPTEHVDALISWGITINLQRDMRWGRNQETISNDPFMLATYAINFTRGCQEGEDPNYIMAGVTLKHAFAYSIEDYHTVDGIHVTRENFNAIVSPFDFYDTYAPHFKAAITPVAQGGGGAIGVMMAMNSLTFLGPNDPYPPGNSVVNVTGGIPCTLDKFLMDDLIFNQWNMTGGYITSDGGNMITDAVNLYPNGHSYCPFHDPPCTVDEAVEMAAYGRCAIADGNEYEDHTVSSVLNGNATMANLTSILYDALIVRFRLGLFDNVTAADSPYWAYGEEHLATDTATAANKLASHQALVLLDRGGTSSVPFLPFPRGTGQSTAVIGFAVNATKNLVGNYVSQYCPDPNVDCFPTILNSVIALGEQVIYAQGCNNAQNCTSQQISQAVQAATSASRIILQLGLDQTLEREQLDRQNVTLPPAQQALFQQVYAAAAGKPIVVILINGGAVAIPEVKASNAGIIEAFYPGTWGGPAIADAVFGIYNPGGKLPVDIYDATYEQVSFVNMSVAGMGRTYRYYSPNAQGGAPLYPFGFGLSYTTFDLQWNGNAPSPITVTPSSGAVTFSFSLSNTGTQYAGDEVIQAFVVPQASSLNPPPPFVPTKYIVGFERVSNIPPQAGTTVDITIDLGLAFIITADGSGTRSLVNGNYDLVFTRNIGDNGATDLSVPVTVSV